MARMIVIGFALLLGACSHYHYRAVDPSKTNEDGARAISWCEMMAPPIPQPFLDNCMRSQGWVRSDQ